MSEKNGARTELHNLVDKSVELGEDQMESIKEDYVFPMPKKIRDMEDEKLDTGTQMLSKAELFKVSLRAVKNAWEQAIRPRILQIRETKVDKLKMGNDFFTEADTQSQEVIKQEFAKAFGDSLRIFAEEDNKYVGNVDSSVGLRIDPIDGTESFKFNKSSDWGVMVGVYTGPAENEHQVMSVVYFPERDYIMYEVEGVGAFTTNLSTDERVTIDNMGTREYGNFPERNDLSDIIISIWKHSDFKQRHPDIQGVEQRLAQKKARIRTTGATCADVLEALLTNGQRAMIIDADFNEVDFIPFPILEKRGYKIYDWHGNERKADDPKIAWTRLIVVPPGEAGKVILEEVKKSV